VLVAWVVVAAAARGLDKTKPHTQSQTPLAPTKASVVVSFCLLVLFFFFLVVGWLVHSKGMAFLFFFLSLSFRYDYVRVYVCVKFLLPRFLYSIFFFCLSLSCFLSLPPSLSAHI
jgi:hypothetical protein